MTHGFCYAYFNIFCHVCSPISCTNIPILLCLITLFFLYPRSLLNFLYLEHLASYTNSWIYQCLCQSLVFFFTSYACYIRTMSYAMCRYIRAFNMLKWTLQKISCQLLHVPNQAAHTGTVSCSELDSQNDWKAVWSQNNFLKPSSFAKDIARHIAIASAISGFTIPGIISLKAKRHEPLLSRVRTPIPIWREEWKSAVSVFINIVPAGGGIHSETEVKESHLGTFTGLEQYSTIILHQNLLDYSPWTNRNIVVHAIIPGLPNVPKSHNNMSILPHVCQISPAQG